MNDYIETAHSLRRVPKRIAYKDSKLGALN